MGRIKITAIKNLADELIEKFGDRFSTDFEKNKSVLAEMDLPLSMQARNWVAGFIARSLAEKQRQQAK